MQKYIKYLKWKYSLEYLAGETASRFTFHFLNYSHENTNLYKHPLHSMEQLAAIACRNRNNISEILKIRMYVFLTSVCVCVLACEWVATIFKLVVV